MVVLADNSRLSMFEIKVQCLVDLVQVYSLTSLSRTSAPLLIVIIVHDNSQFYGLVPNPCTRHHAVMKRG